MSCLVFQLAKCPTEKFKKKTAQELKCRINPQSLYISIRTTTRTNTFENWFKNHLDNDVMNRNMGDMFSLFRPDQSAAMFQIRTKRRRDHLYGQNSKR